MWPMFCLATGLLFHMPEKDFKEWFSKVQLDKLSLWCDFGGDYE